MPVLEWREEYKNLLESEDAAGEIVTMAMGMERRKNPRFKLKTGYVWIKVEPRFEVMDVSVTGISLFSDFQFQSGDVITVTLGIARTVGEFRIIWPMLMAGSLVGGVPAILLYIFLQRLLVQGLTAGAVKE